MSELIQQVGKAKATRQRFLATVSMVSLVSVIWVSHAVASNDLDHSIVWIEFGGQLERIDSGQDIFAPSFTSQFDSDGFLKLSTLEREPRYSNGIEGALQFVPKGSNWTFGVSLRYGRSNGSRSTHNQASGESLATKIILSVPAFGVDVSQYVSRKALRIADASEQASESHAIADFRAGRDLGLGLFGGNIGVDLGVRVAQFDSKSNTKITANPGGTVPIKYATTFAGNPAHIRRPQLEDEIWNIYHASAVITRSFRGIGPSLAFNDSMSVIGRSDEMHANLEFGLNGSVLIGRQKTIVNEHIYDDRPVTPHRYNFIPMTTVYHHRYERIRSRVAVVPNIGGFAGVSFNYANAKVKLGYRADLFFGAIDGGIDSRKDYNRDFYGPFATISVGFGG